MMIKIGAFGVRLDRSCAGGAPGVPITSMRRLTFWWMSYNIWDSSRVKGRWWRERSFFWGHREASPFEKLEYITRMNEQRRLLDMPLLTWKQSEQQ